MVFEDNYKDSKLKVGDHVRISHRNFLRIRRKRYDPNWSKEVSVIKKVIQTVSQTYIISDLNDEGSVGTFYSNDLQKKCRKEFWTEKVIRNKGDRLYFKWKGYNNSFNSWSNMIDIV